MHLQQQQQQQQSVMCQAWRVRIACLDSSVSVLMDVQSSSLSVIESMIVMKRFMRAELSFSWPARTGEGGGWWGGGGGGG